ncbi:2-methylcitrate dehydratase PrpD [Ilumatobacter fluminis]|uniref:2-methylcitrate dehydratase PrpD n=1 Tax=Ilumatobacter fluminis TaxID=467091 RepID=A0A4R7I493_9ACTN|nr:MmgE/PrpD family protein [Ilumatobacter fluminis]TDT18315.1 2-methylcitrate dehydratase PrpD [Ilumatobacter fluminis]
MTDVSQTTGYIERLADTAAALTFTDLPDAVVASVGQRTLDLMGLCLAAAELPTSDAALRFATADGGLPQAHVVGHDVMVPARAAAFANGVLAHSLDYDDTHLPSVLHPSAPVLPAVWAAAERDHRSGEDLILASAIGLELCCRLGMAGYDRDAGNSLFFERGQHATSICGAIAAAGAVAALRGADPATIADACGIAASMAAGIIEANRTGGTVKRIHCGWAANCGVSAADLAVAGITGPPTVLEGRFGFFQAHVGEFLDADALLDGFGERWDVPDIFFKPYPANHFTHAVIDAGIAAREQGVTADDIERVTIGVAGPTVRTVGEPIEVKRAPETGYQAQFSAPFVFAAALAGGGGLGLALDDFSDERANDPDCRALMQRIDVVADAACDEIFPDQFPAVVTIDTRSRGTVVIERLQNRGGPGAPLTSAELARKFSDNAGRRLPADRIGGIVELVEGLARLDDVSTVFEATRP